MRDEKEFEEYVKTLGRQKLLEKKRKIVRLRRIAIAAGSSLAACLCIAFILIWQNGRALSQNDSAQEMYKTYDLNSNDEIYENVTFAPQHTEKIESGCEAAIEETSTEKEEEGDADYEK